MRHKCHRFSIIGIKSHIPCHVQGFARQGSGAGPADNGQGQKQNCDTGRDAFRRIFGIKNLLAITGDHTAIGDNPGAKPVFDLDSVGILQAASTLMNGFDMGGNKLDRAPSFFLGATVTPEYDPIELQIVKMEKKVKAGARFFQTQAVFRIETMEKFKKLTEHLNVPVIAGIIPLRSAGMARFMNKNIPGINIPDNIIDRLRSSDNSVKEGIKIAGELIAELKEKGLCSGVHIMAIGAEENVPLVLDAAGV